MAEWQMIFSYFIFFKGVINHKVKKLSVRWVYNHWRRGASLVEWKKEMRWLLDYNKVKFIINYYICKFLPHVTHSSIFLQIMFCLCLSICHCQCDCPCSTSYFFSLLTRSYITAVSFINYEMERKFAGNNVLLVFVCLRCIVVFILIMYTCITV